MDWHYADGGQQLGPVGEDQLLELAQAGVVKPETLVWHTGMTDWKPFREAGPGAPPPLPSIGSSAPLRHCASCGRQFASSDLAFFGDSAICIECKPAWVQRVRQGMTSTSAPHFRYAGFWIRCGALMIDGLLTGTVFGIAFFAMFGSTIFSFARQAAEAGGQGGQVDPSAFAPVMASIGIAEMLGFVCSVIYSVFFVVKYGATPGKMAVGIKIVTPTGGPISVGQAIGRFFAHILSGIILYIGYIMAGFDEEKRALHDRLAGTRVIHTR